MLSANGWHLLLQNMMNHYDEPALDRFLACREVGNEILDNVPLCDEVISGREDLQGAGRVDNGDVNGYEGIGSKHCSPMSVMNGEEGAYQALEEAEAAVEEAQASGDQGVMEAAYQALEEAQCEAEELAEEAGSVEAEEQAEERTLSAMAELCAVQEAEEQAVEAEKAAVAVDQATKAVEEAQASGDQGAMEAAYQALEEAEAAQCEAEENCEAAEAKVAQTEHSDAQQALLAEHSDAQQALLAEHSDAEQQVIEQASSEGSAEGSAGKQAASSSPMSIYASAQQDCCPSKQTEPKTSPSAAAADTTSSAAAADTSNDAAADDTAKPAPKSGEELAQCHPELAAAISEVLLALPGVGRNMLRMHVAPEHPQVFQMSSKEMDAITGFVKDQMAEQLDALSVRDQERSLAEVGMQPEDLCEIERQTQEMLQKVGHKTTVRAGHSKVSWDGSTRCEGLHVRVTYDRCEDAREDEVKTDTCVFYVKRPHQYDWVDDQESQTWTIEPIKTSTGSESPAH